MSMRRDETDSVGYLQSQTMAREELLPSNQWPWQLVPGTVLTIVACAGWVWAFRLPEMELWIGSISVLGGLIGVLIWLIGLTEMVDSEFVTARLVEDEGQRRERRWLSLKLAVVLPVVVLLSYGLIHADIPRRAKFALNRSALNAFAAGYGPAPFQTRATTEVGGYEFTNIEPIPGGFKCLIRGTFWSSGDIGFAYTTNPTPTDSSQNTADRPFTPIEGCWYYYTFRSVGF